MLYISGGTNVMSDSGWGCTLRCGQMMLSHALILKHLGRGEIFYRYTYIILPIEIRLAMDSGHL